MLATISKLSKNLALPSLQRSDTVAGGRPDDPAIIDIATPLGIAVHDHIIVGKNGDACLKALRLN